MNQADGRSFTGFVLESHSRVQHRTATGKIFGSRKRKKDASLQLWLRHPQHCQALVDTGLGTGHLSYPKCEVSPPDSKHFSAAIEPSSPQISAASTTRIFKMWQWVGSACRIWCFFNLCWAADLQTDLTAAEFPSPLLQVAVGCCYIFILLYFI